MQIALLGTRGYPSTYGGFETFLLELVPYLVGKRHRVEVYTRRSVPRLREQPPSLRIIWTPTIETKSSSTLSHGLTSAVHAAASRPDVALVCNVANGFFLPLLRAAGVPTVVNVDGMEWEREKWGKAARTVFRMGAQATRCFASELVADSQAVAAAWRDTLDRAPLFIPYGAPILEASERPLPFEDLTPGDYVLVVARVVPENNIDLVLDALALLNPPRRAVVVGDGHRSTPAVRRLATLHDRGEVLWLGHVRNQAVLESLWCHAGVYVHGHSVGGTNPALLRAMGAGAPTLALDTAYNREVVRIEELLFPHDAAVLAHRIHRVLSDSATRSKMRAHGREVIRAHYTWDAVLSSYEKVLLEAAGFE